MHLQACVIFNLWEKNETIDATLERDVENATSKWYKILHRIVNVTLTLASCNLAFRGHREKLGKSNTGNFLAVIELLAKYDPVLQELISVDKGNQKYLSSTIQNELIQLLAQKVESEILKDIQSAEFFSVIMDTTQDISRKDQLSQVFRYVTISKDTSGRPNNIKINESFLGFKEVHDQTASGLEKVILDGIEEKGLSLSKCRGQGYDGAATMSGVYSGVKTRIEKKQKTAKYVHCAAHNLNLVLNDAMSRVPENTFFYGIVEKLYLFFSESIKRWELLSSSSLSLKRLCPTRWSSRIDSLKALRYSYVEVMKALSKIILLSKKPDARTEAAGLRKQLESFSFVFQVVLHTKILESVNLISNLLQTKDFDLFEASNLLESATIKLSEVRNNFANIKLSAIALASEWGIECQFENKRIRKVKKHFDELTQDERLTDPEKQFEVTVFNSTLDIVVNQIKGRFESIKLINSMFTVLTPKFLLTATDEEVTEKSSILVKEYEDDLSDNLTFQINSFRIALKSEIENKSSIRQLAELLFLEHYTLASSLPDLCTAFLSFLTLPVTVSSAERSFSKLKLIKNYLRTSMTQQRLSALSVLSIECEKAKGLDLHELIKLFASQKARREKRLFSLT